MRRVFPRIQEAFDVPPPWSAEATPILVVILIAWLFGSPAGAAPSARSTTVRAADTKSWCAAVIATNTKYGTMKNKTFLPIDKVRPPPGRTSSMQLSPAAAASSHWHRLRSRRR